ncbi:hypothetical protein B0A54_15117 [Friedmanniomyces endolithicus]|uniref:Cation/H+ exchanger transmembrane domain-containing protein n=1 Tax=Friedmanniomyces endolithicus TaxID=329885 RepID=A0A4U0UF54_9PEZI|nr:hypothetical protein B0A54_15117 [Friedmanniomyces endolithicus]
MSSTGRFLQYHQPDSKSPSLLSPPQALTSTTVVDLLILISFFALLWLSQYLAAKIIRAGILGPIVAGIIYGAPLANILLTEWQTTFLALGYIGLILLIFEGGLQARLDLLQANILLSVCAATTGIIFPIGLSFLLLYMGFGYGAVETFIVGAALSSTSLGTTFAVMSSASETIDFSQTRVGAVLVSAALIDDVSGLVMSSVIQSLGSVSEGGSVNLGWLISRPIVASIAMTIITPVLAKYVLAPVFRKFLQHRLARYGHRSNIVVMILVLCAFITIAAYAGTSVLFGGFLAGVLLSYLPSARNVNSPGKQCESQGGRQEAELPSFVETFEHYVQDVQRYVLEPLFFASIGFAIPFLDLWTGSAVWHGVVYTLLMIVAKLVVGVWIPLWAALSPPSKAVAHAGEARTGPAASRTRNSRVKAAVSPGCLLGMAMVARGEIGLLIIQIGFNSTTYLSQAAFVTGIWAILLNTIIGPIAAGMLVKHRGKAIGEGVWGVIPEPGAHSGSTHAEQHARRPDRTSDAEKRCST